MMDFDAYHRALNQGFSESDATRIGEDAWEDDRYRQREDDLEPEPDADPCENCGGSGVIVYTPNMNPCNFPGSATAKCTRCDGTGYEPPQGEKGGGE